MTNDDDKIDLGHLRVLIADDNAFMRQILKTVLRGFGVKNTYEANDGTDAFSVIASHQIDLCLMDIEMAPMNGLEFTRRLRRVIEPATSATKNLPVILVSSHARVEVIEKARSVGANSFVVKPVQPKALRTRIIKALGLG